MDSNTHNTTDVNLATSVCHFSRLIQLLHPLLFLKESLVKNTKPIIERKDNTKIPTRKVV
jgi:hypothetical protein